MSDYLRPHGLQHTRLPCSSLSPRVCSNSRPLSWSCYPIISSSCQPLVLPSVFPSIRIFSSELVLCIREPKYWSFSMRTSNEYLGLISFRTDQFDLTFQATLKSLFQHHSLKASIINLKASIIQCSAFFIVQQSHPYMNTGKNYAFDHQGPLPAK